MNAQEAIAHHQTTEAVTDLNAAESIDTAEMMRQMGERDGRTGLSPSCTSDDYWKGYMQGQHEFTEERWRISTYPYPRPDRPSHDVI